MHPGPRPSIARRLATTALIAPSAVLYLVLLAAPLALIIPLAFDRPRLGPIVLRGDWSGVNFARIASGSLYQQAVFNSVIVSLSVVAVALVLGFAVAWQMARIQNPRRLNLAVLAVLAALQVDVVLRLFGLVALLGDAGMINRVVQALGGPALALMYNRLGVTLGLAQLCVPIVVLTLLGALRQIDADLIDTARSLGAGTATILRRIVLPWVAPQLAGAALLVFGLAFSSYVVPALMAGGRVPVLAMQLFDQIMGIGNWQMGAALALVLLVVANAMILANLLLTREGRA